METSENNSRFFQNRNCRHFPCHPGLKEEEFNCLFCYCPLYTLGKQCGGNYRYTEAVVKSCVNCVFPHRKENYSRITARFEEIRAVVRKMDGEEA
jgi:Zn-finger protein